MLLGIEEGGVAVNGTALQRGLEVTVLEITVLELTIAFCCDDTPCIGGLLTIDCNSATRTWKASPLATILL
jgi:hypothetical protein